MGRVQCGGMRHAFLILGTLLTILLSALCSLADEPILDHPNRLPVPGHRVRVVAKHKLLIPGDSSVFARAAMDPLVLIPGETDKETFEARGPLGVIHGGRLHK